VPAKILRLQEIIQALEKSYNEEAAAILKKYEPPLGK